MLYLVLGILLVLILLFAYTNNIKKVDRVVLFSSRDCKICQDLQKDVWPRLVEDNPDITFENIDCYDNKAIVIQYGIHSFPTLVLVRDDTTEIYSGLWTYEDINEKLT
jgi:thiol-disulfide isomerase/thioredoxin